MPRSMGKGSAGKPLRGGGARVARSSRNAAGSGPAAGVEGRRSTSETGDRRAKPTPGTAASHAKELLSEIKVLRGHCRELERTLARSRRINDDMRKTLANYTMLFADSLNPIFVINDKGHFATANAAALRFTECSMRELKKKRPWEFGPPGKREEQKKEYSAPVGRRTAEMEFLIRGKSKTLLLNFLPLKLGKFSFLYVIGQDLTERRRTEQALSESEATARALLNAPTDTIFLVDRHGRVVSCNTTAAQRFGLSPEEMKGKTLPQLIKDPVLVESRSRAIQQVFARGRPVRFQDERDGHYFDVVSYPVTDAAGDVVMAAIVARDITELETARKELAEKEAALAEAQAIAHLASWESEIATGRERWSDEQYRMFGFEPGSVEPTFALFESLVHPDDRAKLLRFSPDSVPTSEPVEFEFRIIRPDGELRWLHSVERIFADERGRAVRAAGTNLDITRRKLAEERAAQAQAVAAALFSSPSDAVYLLSLDGTYLDCNETGARMLGMTTQEVKGRTRVELVPPRSAEQQAARIVEVARTGKPMRLDIEHGGLLFDVGIYPVPDLYGVVSMVVVVARDITEFRRAQQERSQLREQLFHAQKLESLGILAGGIAHDFNNLLTSILGQADLTLLSLPPGSPARPSAEEIVKTARRAAGLTGQLLAYSGKGTFSTRVVDLGAVLREMSNLLQVSVSKKTTLKIDTAAGIPGVEADVSQLRQVIMNLVLNASEALNGDTGVVSVTVGSRQFDDAFLSKNVLGGALIPGTYVYLEVEDTGCGMDPALIEKAFDPFFSTKFSGRGLGLATVLGIVKGHGGAIGVDSVPGKGTKFTILFPPSAKPPQEEREGEETAPEPAGSGTILLVDDEDIVRDPAGRMLTRLGYSVLTAANGVEALEVFNANRDRIDCVILDLTMPEMSGEEAFRKLRELKGDLKVILSSGYGETESIRSFPGRGPDGFLQKPYRLKQLASMLKKLLGEGGKA